VRRPIGCLFRVRGAHLAGATARRMARRVTGPQRLRVAGGVFAQAREGQRTGDEKDGKIEYRAFDPVAGVHGWRTPMDLAVALIDRGSALRRQGTHSELHGAASDIRTATHVIVCGMPQPEEHLPAARPLGLGQAERVAERMAAFTAASRVRLASPPGSPAGFTTPLRSTPTSATAPASPIARWRCGPRLMRH
jgi:hypothetical protein